MVPVSLGPIHRDPRQGTLWRCRDCEHVAKFPDEKHRCVKKVAA